MLPVLRLGFFLTALLLLSGTAPKAADTSPIAGQLPDTAGSSHVYLFTLKKNGISLRMSPKEFCNAMDYGDAVFPVQQANDEVQHDGKSLRGELEWVICRFKTK